MTSHNDIARGIVKDLAKLDKTDAFPSMVYEMLEQSITKPYKPKISKL